METTKIKEISFTNITFQDIKSIVNIEKKVRGSKFDNWFSFKYKISESENSFFQKLINKNELYLSAYNEEQLKMKFLSLILDKVDFFFDDKKDWYDYSLSATVNGTLIKGRPDFMVAKGDFFPSVPYFFLQEFKPSYTAANPEFQLLAEMLVAMQINKKKNLQGAYVIGRNWLFVILEKLKNGDYEYCVSESFDCLKINEIKQIYINLQAVKVLFCKD